MRRRLAAGRLSLRSDRRCRSPNQFGTTAKTGDRQRRVTLDEQRAYDDATFNAEAIARSERPKTLCGYFDPGQFIPVHAPDSDITIVVQFGRRIVRAGETTHEVSAGSIVTVPSGTDRGIKAGEERLEAVLGFPAAD